jgi:hypothetical protein
MNIWPGVVLLVGLMVIALAFTLPTILRDLRRPPR